MKGVNITRVMRTYACIRVCMRNDNDVSSFIGDRLCPYASRAAGVRDERVKRVFQMVTVECVDTAAARNGRPKLMIRREFRLLLLFSVYFTSLFLSI
ncbi:hypothetical protein QTP88_022003 [Uroleucon formosanum]